MNLPTTTATAPATTAARRAVLLLRPRYDNELQLTATEMTRHVLAACGRADLEPDIRGEAVHEIAHQYLSAAKARERLGWTPAHGIDEGLRRTVAWYRGRLGHAAAEAA